MAPPSNVKVKRQWTESERSALKQVIAQLNALITDVRAITAKLDAENVTNLDNDYSASAETAAKIDVL